MASPFPTQQAAETYLSRITDAAKREATRLKLMEYGFDFSTSSAPPAQAVPEPEKQASGRIGPPPPRKVAQAGSLQIAPRVTVFGHPETIARLAQSHALAFSLPYPPSMNAIWRAVVIFRRGKPQARVLLSQQGRDYRRSVLNVIRSLGNPKAPAGARLTLTLTVYPPDRRARDLSNIPKALEDALTHAQVWADDSLIDELHVLRGEVVSGGRVDVRIEPLTNTLFEGHL